MTSNHEWTPTETNQRKGVGVRSYPLDGEWTLVFFEERAGERNHPRDVRWEEGIAAPVPGTVEEALMGAGVLPDLYFGENLPAARPFEFYEWWYRTAFSGTKVPAGCRADLVFEGLDCFATIWLNGGEVGRADNMLIAHRFDVTKVLHPGGNELVVRLESAVNAARRFTLDPSDGHLPTNFEQLHVRKAPHMYGWDIAPRLVSAGIWRSVRMEIHEPAEIVDLYYVTRRADEGSATLQVHYRLATDAPTLDGFALRFTGQCGDSRFVAGLPVWFTSGVGTLDIVNPRRWWPRGYGDPDLYEVTCELLRDGKVVASRTDRVGLRTLTLRRTEITTAEAGGEFRFEVNETPILVKGANWVPLDALHARDAGRLPRALSLFADLGCNMIRCWGGNVYEDHPFFDFCDEHGIMVWQDFAFACARYPQTPEFLERARREAEAVVRKLRNHPSLAVWCGDNECDDSWLGAGLDPAHNRLTREVLPQVVRRCDPWRAFVPSSPYHAPEQVRRGDPRLLPEQHLWGPRDYFKSRFYTESTAHFIGEIGYHGCPCPSSLRRFLDEDHLWPWQDNPQWILHATDSPPGGPYRYRVQLMADQIRELFGAVPSGLDDFALASQISQAEAKKFFVEMVRLRKWRRTGVLWWNVLDCWPQFSDAVVDYYFTRKLAYYYLRRVQQPVCLMVDEPQAWHVRVVAGNDSRRPAVGEFRLWDADSGETLLSGGFKTERNANHDLGHLRISHGEQRLFLLEWTLGETTYGNHYLLGTPPLSFERYRLWLEAIARLPEPFTLPVCPPAPAA